MTADLPDAVSDPKRLAAVTSSGLLGMAAQPELDELTREAREALQVPYAFLTTVDEAQSWYTSCMGLPVGADRSGPVETSFCQYVIASSGPLFVDDARLNPLTKHNRAITEMGVIAWAGFPIWSDDGDVLGTFCVVDTVPRHWSPHDFETLEGLAARANQAIAARVAVLRADARP